MRYSVKRPLGIIRIRSLATVPVLIPTPWSDCNWRFFVFANAFSSWCIKVKRRFSPETYNPQFSSNDFLLTFNGKCSNLDHLNSTHLVVQRELLEAHRAPGVDGQSLRVAHPALRRDPQKPVWNLFDTFSISLNYKRLSVVLLLPIYPLFYQPDFQIFICVLTTSQLELLHPKGLICWWLT